MSFERLITSPDPVLAQELSQVPTSLEWPQHVKRWAFLNFVETGNPEFRKPLWLLSRTDVSYVEDYGERRVLGPEEVSAIVPTALTLSGAKELTAEQAYNVLQNPYKNFNTKSLDAPIVEDNDDTEFDPFSASVADPAQADIAEMVAEADLRQEIVSTVRKSLNCLSDKQREAIKDAFGIGLPEPILQGQTAERLGISREAVRFRTGLGLQKLRKRLELRRFAQYLK